MIRKSKTISYLLWLLLLPVFIQAQEAQRIGTLFDSLKTHPQTRSDEINLEKAITGKNLVYSKLYPSITAFGTYENSSSPNGMVPLAPNELFSIIKDQTLPQPFSKNIFRIEAAVSMPVFALSIYTTAGKARMMIHSAQALKHLNLLKNEAILVSSNANIQYLDALSNALQKKKQSLLKTREIINIKVKNQRAPGSALLKIDDGINEIKLLKNEISIQREQVISAIRALTGITLQKAVPMTQKGTYLSGALRALDPLKNKLKADQLGFKAEKEKLLPSITFNGNYNHSMANAYNNNLRINEDFTTFGLGLHIPIFTKSQYTQIKMSKLDMESTENELAKMKLELSSQARQLQNSLSLINLSLKLYANSVKNKTELLKIARVSYESDQMTIEDYLKYEDDLVLEKSKLYKARAQKWQTLMQLAVIYGNNIENIVK